PLPSGADDPLILVDWRWLSGPNAHFEISGKSISNVNSIGQVPTDGQKQSGKSDLKDDNSNLYTFSVAGGQTIEISHTNEENEEIDYELSNSSGNVIQKESSVEVPSARSDTIDGNEGYFYTESGGTFLLKVTATNDRKHHPDRSGLGQTWGHAENNHQQVGSGSALDVLHHDASPEDERRVHPQSSETEGRREH
ncbi:MAG: hypothetical protein ABEL76_17560, partial [Bradymonadaceae bacterium]